MNANPELLAARLTGAADAQLTLVRGGGNNQLYRVDTGDRTYALKMYAGNVDESRSRYAREFNGLRYLWSAGERRIAEPLALDAAAHAALYAWIEGSACGTPASADIATMADFARALHTYRAGDGAGALLPAREAVLSHAMLQEQIAVRIARYRAVEAEYPALRALLDDIVREAVRRDAGARGVVPVAARTLSPSDFGTHNAVRGAAGLVFVDFEYFGWDDPVKLVADVLWHPGMGLEASLRQEFYDRAADIYAMDPGFEARFEREAPLYGLRWALIILGEFLPEVWQRRVAAGLTADPSIVRARQLDRAGALVARSRKGTVIA